MNPILLMLLAFVAAVLGVFGLYSLLTDLIFRDRSHIDERVDQEFVQRRRDLARKTVLFRDLEQLQSATQEAVPGLRMRFKAMVEQSGLDISPNRLLTIAFVVGLMVAMPAGAFASSVLVAVGAGLAGFGLPLLYVQLKRTARQEALRAQLPDAFDLMARVMRAGQTMSQSLQAVADEFKAPIGGEFAFAFEQQNLGMPPEDALRDLGRRTGLMEIKIFVLALVVQRQTGGNLAELLDKLSRLVRERFRIRGLIKTLTAEGRFQGIILLGLPAVMFLLLLALNPSYALTLFERPRLVVGTIISELIGALWIRQIVNFDF